MVKTLTEDYEIETSAVNEVYHHSTMPVTSMNYEPWTLWKQITTHNNNSWWFMVFNATFNNILTTDENVEYQNK
jgi:hypothetical protein